jgi:hypothetical protein
MTKIGFQRLTVIFANLTAAIAAGLTLLGVLDSSVVLGGAILAAIIVISFQLGMQYRARKQA